MGSEKAVRAVCYSPEKRVTIQQACENNSPVKISGTKRNRFATFNANREEYTITRPAKITRTDVDFKVNESLAHNLITVKDCLITNIFETVDLKVKIITKSERKQPISINLQTKYQADCIVADVTGSTNLVLWEEVIDKIHSGKSYYGKAFWTKAVEFFSDGRQFSRTVEIFLGRSRFFSYGREFSRTVENFLGRSRIFSDGREFSRTVEILNFLRQSKIGNSYN